MSTIIVDGNKTLGAGDDGTVQCIEVAATITLPGETSWKFKKEDEFTVVSNADGDVVIIGQDDVTLVPEGITLSAKGNSANIKYQGNNTYLVWGSLCVALIAGMAALTYGYQEIVDGATMLINWVD